MASEKKIKDQQRFNKSVKEELKLREMERTIVNDLLKLTKVKGKISNDAKKTQQDLAASLTESFDLETESEKVNARINVIQKAKLELIEEAEEKGEAINAHLINQLDQTENILKGEREKAAINDELLSTTKNILGLDTEIEQAIAKGGVAALAMNKAFENIGTSLTAHVDTLKQMVTQQGLSVKEAMALKGSVDMASMSLTGMLYGSDALAESASAITEKFGNVNAATSEMIKGVTEVASLTGDAASATDLVVAFQDAGVEAGDVSDHIKTIAEKHGVNAKKMLEGLTSQTHRLKSASKEQLDSILEQNAALIKQGTNMDNLNATADSMLDIESSLKAAAKARVMLGRDVNDSAVRAAAIELKSATSEDERAAAREKMSQAILDGVGGQEEFNKLTDDQLDALSATYGMTKDQLTTQMANKKVQDELTAKYGDSADTVQALQGAFASATAGAGTLAIEFGKVYLKALAFKLVSGEGIGGATKMFGGLSKVLGLNKIATVASTVATGIYNGVIATKNFLVGAATALMNSNFIVKTKDFILDKASAAQALVVNGYMAARNLIMNTTLGRYIALGAAKLVDIARGWLSVGSTAAQTTANFGLAGSQQLLGTTGATAGGGMAAAGAGLGAFGTAAAPAIPIILAIGAALLLASPAIYAFSLVIQALAPIITGIATVIGNVLMKAIDKLPEIITAVANGFVSIMEAVTPENVLGMLALGPALLSASVGMIAFSAAMLVGGLGSLFGGGIISEMTDLAMIGPQLAIAGEALASVAGNISIISESLQGLGGLVTPLYALAGGLMSISGGLSAVALAGIMAIPIFSALGGLAAITPTLEGLGSVFGGDESSEPSTDGDSSLITEIKALGKELIGMRGDIQSQPILINVDGKVVSKISRVQSRQVSSKNGFGG